VPEIEIPNLLILNRFLSICRVWGGQKLTNRKQDRSGDEISTLWQEEKEGG